MTAVESDLPAPNEQQQSPGPMSGADAVDTSVTCEQTDDAGAATDPRAALAAALARADENYELYLRSRAETENVRRRAQDDISRAHKFAIESFAEALVPVSDSLEKALQDVSSNADALR